MDSSSGVDISEVIHVGAWKADTWKNQVLEIKTILDPLFGHGVHWVEDSTREPCDLVFLSMDDHGALSELPKVRRELAGEPMVVGVGPSLELPPSLLSGELDDVLVSPFRPVEVLGKIRLLQRIHRQKGMSSEVTYLNEKLESLLGDLEGNLALAERLQMARSPKTFDHVKGIRVRHRYFSGTRSGGDHFDFVGNPEKSAVSFVMTDSSSYGLSSSVLKTLMGLALKLGHRTPMGPSDILELILPDLQLALHGGDELSIFLGSLEPGGQDLQFICLGNVQAWRLAHGSSEAEFLASGHSHLTAEAKVEVPPSQRVSYSQGDRLILVTDGVQEVLGQEGWSNLLQRLVKAEKQEEVLNEFSYEVKKTIKKDSLSRAPHDCTLAVLDRESPGLRLA